VRTPRGDKDDGVPRLRLGRILRDTFAVYRAHWVVLVPVTMVVLAPQAIGDALIGEIEVEGVKRPEDLVKLASVPVAVAVNLAGEALLSGIAPRSSSIGAEAERSRPCARSCERSPTAA